jgi:hypothetical protein
MVAASHVAALTRFATHAARCRSARATAEMHDWLRKNKLEQIADFIGHLY